CGAHDSASVVSGVGYRESAARQIRQADQAAALSPSEGLGTAGSKRAANHDSLRRDPKRLRSGVAYFNHADIEDLILRLGGGGCRDDGPRDENGNSLERSHAAVCARE